MARLALCALLCAALLVGVCARDDVLVNEHGHDEADNDLEVRYDDDSDADRNLDADTFSHFEFRESRDDSDTSNAAADDWVTPEMQAAPEVEEAQLLETQAHSRSLFRSLHTRARRSSRTYAEIGPSGSGGSSLASQSSIVTGSAPAAGVPDAVVSSSISRDADGSKTLGGAISLPPGSDDSSPGVVNTGSSRIHTDREGHHFIVLTNNNVLAQTVPDTAQQILAAAAAQSVAKQILDMARRRAVVQNNVVSEATTKQSVQSQLDTKRKTESTADAAAEAARKEQGAEAARKRLIVTLQSPFMAFGDGYIEPKASRVDTLCVVEGMIKGPSGLVGVLGPDCRPVGRLSFAGLRTGAMSRIDVMPDGRVFVIAGGSDGWVLLDGIAFTVGADKELELLDKWIPLGAPFRVPTVSKVGDACLLSGVIKTTSGSWDKGLANVPMECWPTQRITFGTCNHEKMSQLDLYPTGQLAWTAGGKEHNWVALDGIAYCTQEGGVAFDLEPTGGWTAVGEAYRRPKYCMVQGLCMLSGVITNSKDWSGLIATLPSQCRPAKRAPFAVTVGSGTARVDVFPNGEIRFQDGKASGTWLPLDGIRFMSSQVAALNAGSSTANAVPSTSSVQQPSGAVRP